MSSYCGTGRKSPESYTGIELVFEAKIECVPLEDDEGVSKHLSSNVVINTQTKQ